MKENRNKQGYIIYAIVPWSKQMNYNYIRN